MTAGPDILDAQALSQARGWTTEQVILSGDEFYERLIADIRSAQRSVEIETYIFERDRIGNRVLEALKKAARRGVRVRVLVDGIGSISWTHRFLERLNTWGIDASVYHPLPWQVSIPILGQLLLLTRRFSHLLSTLNRRDHRKVYLIDGAVAYSGGMNISAKHAESVSGERAWRDTVARVEGPDVSFLLEAFEAAWLRKHDGGRTRRLSPLVRLNDSRMRRQKGYAELIGRIVGARTRVWITTPYFVPDLSLVRALRYAAWSGVDVKVLLPKRSDIYFTRFLANAFYTVLLKSGVTIYEYLPTVLHSKTVLIDGWATVGSANLNHRSLIHDLEVNLVLTSPDSRRTLASAFEDDLLRSRKVVYVEWSRRPLINRMFERMALLLRYWV